MEPTYEHLKELDLWDAAMLDDPKYFDSSIAAIQRIVEYLKARFPIAFEIAPGWIIYCNSRRQKLSMRTTAHRRVGLGLNANMFNGYGQHIADRRLERIGLKAEYGSKNSFSWMTETIDRAKKKNFFETRVTEYQSAANFEW